MARTIFSDLPEDVILLVVPYLRPKEYLALCSVNKHFYDTYRLEPSYWREETRNTFRLPIHPLLKADGLRWHWLYNKLLTKTRVYTWGQGVDARITQTRGPVRATFSRATMQYGSAWPLEADGQDDIGVVVDAQCGGWSNTLLNSNGMLYTTGKLDGTQFRTESSQKQSLMKFSPAYPSTTPDRYEPSTAIKQFSSGRRHVLALSDSGKIWFWTNKKPAMQVKFLHLDILEGDQRRGNRRGVVKKVVAGWEESSAYVSGAGIVYWNIFKNEITRDEADEPDTVLLEATTIPGTNFKRPKTSTRESNQQEHEIGEVLNHIVLHEYIVFVTDLNKVFAMNMKPVEEFDESDRTCGIPPNDVFELTTFSAPNRQFKDIQGAFERFAVFSSDGSVQIGDRNMLRSFWNHQRWPLEHLLNPKILPALQSSNVISLAFGDHHMHALHSSGRISSYGTEPQGCGALGLGEKDERFLRGVYTLTNRDGTLVPHAEHHPHYIWFEEDKRNWLYRLNHAAQKSSVHERRNAIVADPAIQGEFSEWIEQEGLAWDDFPDIRAQDPDGLGAYFALTVAAAGWHSCALVLVNDDLAKQVKIKHINGGANIPPDEEYLLIRSDDEAPSTNGYENQAIQAFRYDFFDQPFPRLTLPSGYEMPGEGAFNEWRYGMPPVRWRAEQHGYANPAVYGDPAEYRYPAFPMVIDLWEWGNQPFAKRYFRE